MELVYTPATLADLDTVSTLEAMSYHPDEAASREQLAKRIGYASQSGPELFTVARNKQEEIVAFLCTTLTRSNLVTDDSMSFHDPTGNTICLHSVCVSPNYRKQGIATRFLNDWIQQVKKVNDQQKKYIRIALLSRPKLIGLYEGVGFQNKGTSEVVHGPEPWIDMILDL